MDTRLHAPQMIEFKVSEKEDDITYINPVHIKFFYKYHHLNTIIYFIDGSYQTVFHDHKEVYRMVTGITKV